jgi:hypothetical protein
MKIIITENNLKNVIFKYFDKQVEKGGLPHANRLINKIFKIDEETVFSYLVDYHGGEDGAIELTRKMLRELPDRIKINDSQFNGEIYFSIIEVGEYLDKYNDMILPISVDCYGDLIGVDVWNDEEDEYDNVDTTLANFYEQEDMTGGWEIRDTLVSDINNQLFDMITRYTGISVSAEDFSVVDG